MTLETYTNLKIFQIKKSSIIQLEDQAMNKIVILPKNIEKSKLDMPKKIALYLLNDDFTTMEFVVKILIKFFYKNNIEAEKIMMLIHTSGKALCGIYPIDAGITKLKAVNKYSKDNSYPLRCVSKKI